MATNYFHHRSARLGLVMWVLTIVASPGSAETPREKFMLGVDANYSLDMEARGARWRWVGREQELFAGMQKQSARWLRVRLWTSDESANGDFYATAVVERANKPVSLPILSFF